MLGAVVLQRRHKRRGGKRSSGIQLDMTRCLDGYVILDFGSSVLAPSRCAQQNVEMAEYYYLRTCSSVSIYLIARPYFTFGKKRNKEAPKERAATAYVAENLYLEVQYS